MDEMALGQGYRFERVTNFGTSWKQVGHKNNISILNPLFNARLPAPALSIQHIS